MINRSSLSQKKAPRPSFRGSVHGSMCDHSLGVGYMWRVGPCMCGDQRESWEFVRGAPGPHLHVPFAALVTGDHGHRAPRRHMRFRCMFHVACVSSGYCICCNGYTRMLQVYLPNVLVSSGCCICCSGYTCMLQVYVPNVDVCCKYFI
jgi:hypothetical protein